MNREWIYLLPGSSYKKQNRQNIFLILDIRQIRWMVSGRRETKWTHGFPELITWGSFQAAERKGNLRRAQWFSYWAYRVGSLREAKQLELERKKTREQRNAQKESSGGGSLLNIHLSVYRCKLWGNFPGLGKEPPDVSKKKIFAAQ